MAERSLEAAFAMVPVYIFLGVDVEQTLDTQVGLCSRYARPVGALAGVGARMVAAHVLDVKRAAAAAVHQDGHTRQIFGGLAVVVPGDVEGRVAVHHGAGQLVVVAHVQGRIDGQRGQLGRHFSSKRKNKN